jgi:hypothetical protein
VFQRHGRPSLQEEEALWAGVINKAFQQNKKGEWL